MITIGNKKVKVIKSRILKNGAIGAYVRYPDKSIKWRIIGKKYRKGGANNKYNYFSNKPSASFSFSGPAYKSQNQKLKAIGIKPNRLKVKAKNIRNLISNKNNINNIKTEDQKKYEYSKTQSDSFSNNNLFGMQYFCELSPKCRKFRSSVKPKYAPADYQSNSRAYNAAKKNINISKHKISYKNIKNLISNKQ